MLSHVSRGMEMRETCPSRYQTMAISNVSVRCDVPLGLRSEPMSRKLMVSLFVRSGSGVGFVTVNESGGGAAWMEAVAVGGGGGAMVGDKVSVGRISCGVGLESNPEIGISSDGWKGVGVAVAFGAEVIMINGKGAGSGVGAPHEDSKIARRKDNVKRWNGFIDELERC